MRNPVVQLQQVALQLINEPLGTSHHWCFTCRTNVFLLLWSCFPVLLHCHVQSRQPEGFGAAHRGRQRLRRVGGCNHTGQVAFSLDRSPANTTGSDLRMCVWQVIGRCIWVYTFFLVEVMFSAWCCSTGATAWTWKHSGVTKETLSSISAPLNFSCLTLTGNKCCVPSEVYKSFIRSTLPENEDLRSHCTSLDFKWNVNTTDGHLRWVKCPFHFNTKRPS